MGLRRDQAAGDYGHAFRADRDADHRDYVLNIIRAFAHGLDKQLADDTGAVVFDDTQRDGLETVLGLLDAYDKFTADLRARAFEGVTP